MSGWRDDFRQYRNEDGSTWYYDMRWGVDITRAKEGGGWVVWGTPSFGVGLKGAGPFRTLATAHEWIRDNAPWEDVR